MLTALSREPFASTGRLGSGPALGPQNARAPDMRLGLRVFFGFFLIAGLSAVLLLKVFLAEVKPSVREVMEDLMVDTAHLLAEQAADEMDPVGLKPDSRLAAQLQRYVKREVD